jgi:hypothetical protein
VSSSTAINVRGMKVISDLGLGIGVRGSTGSLTGASKFQAGINKGCGC